MINSNKIEEMTDNMNRLVESCTPMMNTVKASQSKRSIKLSKLAPSMKSISNLMHVSASSPNPQISIKLNDKNSYKENDLSLTPINSDRLGVSQTQNVNTALSILQGGESEVTLRDADIEFSFLSKIFSSLFVAGVSNDEIEKVYSASIGMMSEFGMTPNTLYSFTDDGLEDESIKQILQFSFPFNYKIQKCKLDDVNAFVNDVLMTDSMRTASENMFVFSLNSDFTCMESSHVKYSPV